MKRIIVSFIVFFTASSVYSQNEYSKEDLQYAINVISKEILADSNDASKYSTRGKYYYLLGEYDLSLKDCNKAISLKPKNADYYNNRGITYLDLNNLENAEKDFLKAISLNKKLEDAYYNLGYIYMEKDLNRSIEYFSECIKLNKNNVEAWNTRGYANMKLSKFDAAISDYSMAISRAEVKQPIVFYNRAKCYIEIGEYANAYNDAMYGRSISHRGNGPAMEILGYYYYKTNNLTKACEVWGDIGKLSDDYEKIRVANCK